ncbi:hypothetical protein HaLaN_17512 [Haematococcus lacustris]|uniref:Uncharacterized protein n=1 Tax=Haematococcus lacustris TaxID=44745 RepID=A0A699ZE39_HAELA|nr:hypothetical protein HaLaN_17512 [Haematococcus lacustris]
MALAMPGEVEWAEVKTGIAIGVFRCGQPHVTPDVSQSQTVLSYTGRYARMCTRSRLSLAYHSATWPPPTQLNPPPPNLVYPAQLPAAQPAISLLPPTGRRVGLHHGLSPLASCSRTKGCCSGSAWWQWLERAYWCPSNDDGLHAFELYRHTQDVLARLGTWDTLPLLAGALWCYVDLLPASCAGSNGLALSAAQTKLRARNWRYMELPALLQLMSLRTCKEAIKTVDVYDLQQRMGQLRAEVRRKEDAAVAAQRSAKAERQIIEAAHKVGRVVV